MTLPWKVGLGLLAVVAAMGLFWEAHAPSDVRTTIVRATPSVESTR